MAAQFLKVLETQPPDGIYEISTVAQGNLLVEAVDGAGSSTPLAQVAYVDAASTAPSPDGSIGAPFLTVSAALTALALTGGVLQIVPGDYSGETPDPIPSGVPWSFVGLALDVPNPAGPLVQLPSLTFVAAGAQPISFRSINAPIITAHGTERLQLIDCSVFGIDAAGRAVELVDCIVSGGGIAGATLQCQGLNNTSTQTALLSGASARFLGCVGQLLAVTFAAPGGQVFTDITSRAMLGLITNGDLAPLGFGVVGALPVGVSAQSITGATTQLQVDSIVAAGVALGFWTDDR